jgi:protein TonB
MFDLITGRARHIPSRSGVPLLVSFSAQLALVGAVLAPVLRFVGALPEVPTVMAFVADVPATTPPPPPPPPAAARIPTPPAHAVPTTGAAPIEAPSAIRPEPVTDPGELGVPGGVEGGIPGGFVGGVVGGLPSDIPPPPPPAPPTAPRAPIRVGGQRAGARQADRAHLSGRSSQRPDARRSDSGSEC